MKKFLKKNLLMRQLKKFIAWTPTPTLTNTLLPKRPKIQQRKANTQAPPPIATELLDLLKQQLAPKQIPVKPNIAVKLPKQYKNVLNVKVPKLILVGLVTK